MCEFSDNLFPRRIHHEAQALYRREDYLDPEVAPGRRIRVLNIVDDFSREAILQLPEFSFSGLRVALELDGLLEARSAPKKIVCDNGPEFTSKAMFFWARERRIKLHFIQPGKPTQDAFVESLNGKFRHYRLNLHWLASLEDAREIFENWRRHYNDVRTHLYLNGLPPSQYERQAA